MARRATKIVATLGPASGDPAVLERMIRAGVNVVRLNFSHGTAQDHIARAAMVREAARKAGREVAIMADLQGPKIRVGKFAAGKVLLVPGEKFVLDAARTEAHPDTRDFHAALKTACDGFDAGWYPKYRKWADDYFFLPHRGEHRGVGGIFYDHHDSGDWDRDFAFTQAVGKAFADTYPWIVRRRWDRAWNKDDRHEQAKWRGRYVEFNLLYDRGTTFGLKTGGNVESILSSMPPIAEWR